MRVITLLFVAVSCSIAQGGEMNLIDKVLGRHKQATTDHMQLGWQKLHSGESHYQDAVEEFSKAIEIDKGNLDAFYGRGLGYHFLGLFDSAISDFDKILDQYPQDALVRFWKTSSIRGQRHNELYKQFSLSFDHGDLTTDEEAKNITKKAVTFLRGLKKYRAELLVKDLTCEELKESQYVTISWSYDFIAPDTFAMWQSTALENFPYGAADGWISIGDYDYMTIFTASVRSERRAFTREIEKFLRVDKYIEILGRNIDNPVEKVRLPNGGDAYLMMADIDSDFIIGDWPIVEIRKRLARTLFHVVGMVKEGGDSLEFFQVPTVSEQVSQYSIGVNPDIAISTKGFAAKMQLLISADNYAPIKAEIDLDAKLENGEDVSLKFEQVFGDLGGDIEIVPPPL
jgi:hypothetical protein